MFYLQRNEINMKRTHLSLLALSAVLFCSCATILSGTRADILIDGAVSEPLTVVADEKTYDSIVPPVTVSVSRKHLNAPITLTSAHYDYADFIPGKETNPMVWVNIFTQPLGLAVDYITGAAYQPKLSSYVIRSRSKEDGDGLSLPPVGLALSSSNRPAQRLYRNEVSVLLGLGSSIGDGAHSRECRRMEQLGFDDLGYCGFTEFGGAFGLRYFYHLNQWLALGGMAGYASVHDSFDHVPGDCDSGSHGAERDRYVPGNAWCHINAESFYAAPVVKASWWHLGALTCYSQAAVGLQYRYQWTTLYVPHYNPWPYWMFLMPYEKIERSSLRSVHQLRLASQLTVFGMDLGRRHLHFFMELGYGIEGVFNMGLSYRFKSVGR